MEELLVDCQDKIFNLNHIKKGDAIYAWHKSWKEDGVLGLVTKVTEAEILIQYVPEIGNIINHYRISATEVQNGEWVIRFSGDLLTIGQYPERELRKDLP